MADTGPESEHWHGLDAPRIPPFGPDDTPVWAKPVLAGSRRVTGGPTANIIATLARHGRLFSFWLPFAGQLMPRGKLPRQDTELVILRVAWNTHSRYEWNHHVRIGARAGLTEGEIERVADGPDAAGWTDRQRALLQATDELHADRFITDDTWAALERDLSQTELIELCILVGHYEMLAMTIASLGIQPEDLASAD
jgi:alkylhydroperoxidase family enzyme